MNLSTSQKLGSDALFTQYIDVINRVIGENRGSAYGAAMQVWNKTIKDAPIAVGVYDGDAKNPHHWYTIRMSDGTFDLVDNRKPDDPKLSWKVDEDHLTHVVDNPKTYVEHPMKLDLDWLQTRVGLA